MSEEFLIRHGAPTLAGIKTGNLFSSPYTTREQTAEEVRSLNHILVPKGLCLLPLRYSERRVLLYLYRPKRLRRDFAEPGVRELLSEAGYPAERTERCVSELVRRINGEKGFPHEIGLFLGYPSEDVRGFIENHARKFKLIGCWKVYGDENAAQKCFARYKACTKVYCRQWERGFRIARLAVSCS